ncbi:MAG: hypothetical protein AB1610_01055 [Nitrospirota bacterium]
MTYNNPIAERIYVLLQPLIGPTMARGSLKVQVEKLGVSEETLSKKFLPELAANIEKGLRVFLGTDKAREVSSNIKNIT